jgi:hypothetical protein
MKILAAISYTSFVAALANGLPDGMILILLTIMIVVDLLTGVTKSVVNKKNVTSRNFRKTLAKFIQYGSALVIGLVLTIMAEIKGITALEGLVPYLNNGIASFIIYIEIVSVVENSIEMNPNAKIVKIIFQPLLYVITFQFKKIISSETQTELK